MPYETACTRAVLPVLGVGIEPVLFEKATGRPMVAMNWDLDDLQVHRLFVDHPEAKIFMLTATFIAAELIVLNWPYVVAEAERYGIAEKGRIVIG